MPRGVVYVWLDSLSHAVRWFRLAVIGLAGVVLLALVITVAPVPQPAAAEPTPTPAPPAGGEGWVQPTGEGVVRPDWVSASVTARASGQRVEVLSQRTEAKRVWVQPSGLVESETFGGPVRFKDPAAAAADGWRDIDTALQANADGSVSPAAASGKVILSGGGSSEVLVTSADAAGRSIQVGSGLPGVALPKPSLDGATATYADVVDGVDLRVEVRRTGFEQLWVIKDQAGLDRFLAARASGATVNRYGFPAVLMWCCQQA